MQDVTEPNKRYSISVVQPHLDVFNCLWKYLLQIKFKLQLFFS